MRDYKAVLRSENVLVELHDELNGLVKVNGTWTLQRCELLFSCSLKLMINYQRDFVKILFNYYYESNPRNLILQI